MPKCIGRYEVLRLVAEGGFGKVFLAKDPDLDRLVAIKVARRELFNDQAQVDNYLKEARLAAKLRHPNIVSIHDWGNSVELGCYIVMDFIDGGPLDVEELSSRMDLNGLLHLLAQVADAVHHAHTRELVHRDLKPSNLLLDSHDKPYVVDFGLAVHDSEKYDHAGEVSGTPLYMSPEQVRGLSHQLDGRTDIWSLGVLLYELVSGRKPFSGDTRARVFDEILNRDPKPLRQINDRISPKLDRICAKALAKKPADRYSTAKDFADDLRTVIADMERPSSPPIPPPVAVPVLTRPARRLWMWPVVGVAVAAAMAGLIFVTQPPDNVDDPNLRVHAAPKKPVILSSPQHHENNAASGEIRPAAPTTPSASGPAEVAQAVAASTTAAGQPAAAGPTDVPRAAPPTWTLQHLDFDWPLRSRCTRLALGAGGTQLAVATDDADVFVFDLASNSKSPRILHLNHPIRSMCISEDGNLLGVLGQGDSVADLYKGDSGEPMPNPPPFMDPFAVKVSSQANSLQFLDWGVTMLMVRDALTSEVQGRMLPCTLRNLLIASSSKELVFVGTDHQSHRWCVLFLESQQTTELNVPGPINSFDVAPRTSLLVLGGYRNKLGVQTWEDGKLTRLPSHPDEPLHFNEVCFFEDGQVIVAVGHQSEQDATVVRAWRLDIEWKPILAETIPAGLGPVAFAPTQGLICLASPTSIRLYQLRARSRR